MRDDFVFCGVCGEPADKNISHDKYVKTKKINGIRRFERKLSRSTLLNGIFGGIWGVIAIISVFFCLGTFQGIRADSAGIGYTYSQLLLKYEYVKEGLSASYVSHEFSEIVNFGMLWVLFVFFVLTLIFGLILAVSHIIRAIKNLFLPFGKSMELYTKTPRSAKRTRCADFLTIHWATHKRVS